MPAGYTNSLSSRDADQLSVFRHKLETLARDEGLDYYQVNYELVPDTFMMEVAIYGLPVRMPHWSFGVRYIYQYVQHRMGASRIFEVMFPGNPNRAYLQSSNSLADNTLVTAHVLGHADFSRHNELFIRMQQEVGYRIVEQAASHAHQIEGAIREHGQDRVEQVLDAALALEQCVDISKPLRRKQYPEYIEYPDGQHAKVSAFDTRFTALPGEEPDEAPVEHYVRSPVPPYPETDLLWFIAQYGPDMEPWERDIFLAVREESYYFYPLFACHIINEGWASYWHARLLRQADFLPHQLYLDAIKAHSDVVRPYAGSDALALTVNPYHLGFRIWERIVDEQGLDAAFQIRAEEDDFGFVRNYLTEDLARELELFVYVQTQGAPGDPVAATGERYQVLEADIHQLHETILASKFNYGAPRVRVKEMAQDGSLTLMHDTSTDGRGLDLDRAQKVLEYIHHIWRRPVYLETVDEMDAPHVLKVV